MITEANEILLWARGPGFVYAISIFVFGMVIRVTEILALGRKPDLSAPRENSPGSGWKTIFTRMVNFESFSANTAITYIAGYIFHLGLFAVVLLFIPHIEMIRSVLHISWPGLASSMIDFITIVTMGSMLVLLVDRIMNPVKQQISTIGDYFGWLVSFLPILTGYMSYHHMVDPYALMLAMHILSVELLLVIIPFTKLTHMVTLFIARWYNGDQFGRKGVAS